MDRNAEWQPVPQRKRKAERNWTAREFSVRNENERVARKSDIACGMADVSFAKAVTRRDESSEGRKDGEE